MRKIGLASHLSPAQARDAARSYLAQMVVTREDPAEVEKKIRERPTLKRLIEDHYKPWLEANRKGWRFTLECLSYFSDFFEKTVEEISPLEIEKWQTEQKAKGLKGASVNRRMAALQALLNWSVRRGLIANNPISQKIERQKESDSSKKIRFLSPEERSRLLQALEDRDRREQDYLKCAVIVSLNTGVRKGTLLRLKWDDIDWKNALLHLPAENMKGGRAKNLPLNTVALNGFSEWKNRSSENGSEYIFPGGKKDSHLQDVKKPWNNLCRAIGLEKFSWHCLRHDFASQLAMQGVDILTIKELMCHESVKMTLVYAHLSPLYVRKAVDGLDALYR